MEKTEKNTQEILVDYRSKLGENWDKIFITIFLITAIILSSILW